MKTDDEQRIEVREYLLGRLADEAREQFEARLMTDDELYEQMLIEEDELADEYIGDELKEDERRAVEEFFRAVPDGTRKVAFARSLRRHVSNAAAPAHKRPFRPWRSIFTTPYVGAAAAVVLLLGLTFVAWRAFNQQPELDRGLAALNEAYRDGRPLEARITDFAYAPLIVTRGERGAADYVARSRAERLLLDAVAERPGPDAYHALGRYYLAERQFDRAVDQFEKATAADSAHAKAHADLGAALLEAGRRQEESGDNGRALESYARSLRHIDRALELEAGTLAPLFNRALILERMGLPGEARRAWESYLNRDAETEWAAEARRRLQALSERSRNSSSAPELLEHFLAAARERDAERAWRIHSRNREVITGKLIPAQIIRQYLMTSEAGKRESAQEVLRAFAFAGQLDRERGGDPYTAELASYYAAATPLQLPLLRQAAAALDAGYTRCLEADYAAAKERFEAARALFRKAGDGPEERLAIYWVAYCLVQLDRVGDSNRLLEEVAAYCRERGYRWLLAHTYSWLAINQSILGDRSRAISYYEQALREAEAVSDDYQTQKILTELGSEYADLKMVRQSFGYYHRSVRLAFEHDGSPRQSWRNFSYATAALVAFGHYAAAAAYARESAELAGKELADPSLEYLARLTLGRIYSRLGRFNEAIDEAQLGLGLARSVKDPIVNQKYVATALLRLADVRREAGECRQAVRDYQESLELYERMEFNAYRYEAYKGRLLCSAVLGDDAAVRRDLDFLLGLYEEQRSLIREEQSRNSFFDAEQDVYDVAVAYEHSKGNHLAALNYAELSRSRSLLDALRSGGGVKETATGPDLLFARTRAPERAEEVSAQIPAEVQALVYTILPSRLIIWCVTRERITVFEREILAPELGAAVRRFVESIEGQTSDRRGQAATIGAELFDLLIRPALGNLAPGRRLCVIPDKFLNQLPFAALLDSQTGKYLIEDWSIFYAPSLNVLQHASREARRRGQSEREQVLSIGNPTFDRELYPHLPDLNSAEREARAVASFYPDSLLLVRAGASRTRVIEGLETSTLIHFAGHYVPDHSSPMQSRMLLAPEPGGGSTLAAHEILRRRLGRARLVVLSACQTGIERYYGGEGAVGLARTFMAAGVPLVLASQWPVESEATAELMINFHRLRRAGHPSIDALRSAQIEMLQGADERRRSPFYWSAFLVAGGDAGY